MDWELEIKDSGYLPKKGKPTEETVCYKIGGTYYEVSTSCGGSERLRDKMIRLIKSETVKPPNANRDKWAIIKLALLFVGRSLQEE